MKKILVIPHHPETPGVRIRLIELARVLSVNNEGYLLNWKAVNGKYTLINRVRSSLNDLFKIPMINRMGNLNIIEFPTLHRPVLLARKFHRLFLTQFISQKEIDIVINGCYLFTLPQRREFRYVVDFADLPEDGFAGKYLKMETDKADYITVASRCLAEYVRETCAKDACFIPNGVHIDRMKAVSGQEIEAIRQKNNLIGKCILGYIGYIGEWINIDLAINAYKLFKREFPASALLWIGPSRDLESLKKKYAEPDIIFTGGINENVEAYFRLLDIGLLPARKSPFQDKAFHLKLIEYMAAGKPVISTPLVESMRLGFPNIIFAEENEMEWNLSFKKARGMVWQKEWNSFASIYDWKNIGEELLGIISA